MRIGDLLRMLPQSVFESTAHLNKMSLDKAFLSSCTVQEQLNTRFGNHQNIHVHEQLQQESPSIAHLTITFEVSTQIKKGIKANRTMEELLFKNAEEFRRL